jgi:SAM-dependent methyltransferase
MIANCRLCGGTDLSECYSHGNDREWKYYRCRTCKVVNYDLSCPLSQHRYIELTDPSDATHRINRNQARSYEFIQSNIHQRGSILEIGCGNGKLLSLAREDGWTVHGIELSSEMAEFVGKTLSIDVDVADFLEYEPPDGLAYDAIVLRHVLEHLPDPVAAMRKIHALLADGGAAALEFPNIDSLDLRLARLFREKGPLRKKYPPDFLPGHCMEFCRASFEYLLNETGFTLEHWSTYSHTPALSPIYNALHYGNKARVLVRKT